MPTPEFLLSALINVLNPKLSIFIPAFMAMTFAVFLIYGALASAAGNTLRRPAACNWIRRSSASAFSILGISLAPSHDR